MIVSGFTQRKKMVQEEETPPGQHSHCFRCRKVNCTQFADNVTTCVMATCESCGWRCHDCKLLEHAMTCPQERVPCVNKGYGCPHTLKRSKMASHLPVCPASVVYCPEEWSRWPMHAKDQGVRLSLPSTKTYIDCGQLDVSLAMRDQRMLIDSLRAPRKLRRTLRNHLTMKYPAVPFPHHASSPESETAMSEDTTHTLSDDETGAPWDLSKPRPGLEESMRSRLFRVTREVSDSVVAALESNSNLSLSQTGLESAAQEDGGGDGEERCGHHAESLSRSLSPDPARGGHSGDEATRTTTGTSTGPPSLAEVREAAEKKMELVNKASSGNFDPKDQQQSRSSLERSVRSSVSSDRCSDHSSRSRSVLHDMGGTQLHKLTGQGMVGNSGDGGGGVGAEGDGVDADIRLHKMLGVNIGHECINKYVPKPASMYSFICAQDFRRDEYPWHFKNVHQEIHQGFCGWLEQRCPLAYLGCNFSFHRMAPAQPNTTLYHSWLQESFGLRSNAQPVPATAAADGGVLPACKNSRSSAERSSSCDPCEASSSAEEKNDEGVKNSDVPSTSGPSICDLANFDRDFDRNLEKDSQNKEQKLHKPNVCDINSLPDGLIRETHLSDSHVDNPGHAGTGVDSQASGDNTEAGHSADQRCLSVRPSIYTAYNWDSKVLFEYDVEEEEETQRHSLTGLPFELLQVIAKKLDSFSLCNLSLTCHLLREVCCTLLDEHGIVLLTWGKQRPGTGALWKVVNKRWIFSTSFEPIKSWRFTEGHTTITDHLKVCPYNQEKVCHSGDKQYVIPSHTGLLEEQSAS
ncbi:F-box only protein 30 [Aplysia californica]|uniref:F-box only protein 30 n=1 Tax=Aplysia californica TaxID=6500 RepID=A0ABM0K1P1_APLCA|nr:F-box only protein 30 [Aplysia californica]